MNYPETTFAHLDRLTTEFGLHEHALYSDPRRDHGYCVDDVSRALVLLCREPSLDARSTDMLELYLEFVIGAITINGRCHNRMNSDGEWIDLPGRGDWWGRAVWCLGFAAVHAPLEAQRRRALLGFRILARSTSPDIKAICFSVLGAGELLLARPDEMCARGILSHARSRLIAELTPRMMWPEPRFTYSNASIPEASIVIGMALSDKTMLRLGISQLEFLLESETRNGHLSVTPVGGRDFGKGQIGFDQQPIEVAAIADASARALVASCDNRWVEELNRAWSWFLGNNDVGTPMYNSNTGGGYDGLHARGPNQNQGAESTISMLSTAQQARLLHRVEAPSLVLTH